MELVAVTNGEMEEARLIDRIHLLAPYVDKIMLREKQKSFSEYLSFVHALIESGVDQQKLCIHRHVEVASMTGIPHLHLPEKGRSVEEVKQRDPYLSVGVSVHSLQAAQQAEEGGADYVMFGHVYPTDCKRGRAPRGLEMMANIVTRLQIPVVAIGGARPNHIKELVANGAGGIAVMSGIFSAIDPFEAVKRYKKEVLVHERTS